MRKIRTSDPDLALGGRVWDDFDTTPSMPTYLVAFMVHELQMVETANDDITVWVRPDAADDAALAAEVAPQAIKAMELYTDVALPVPKVDLVAIPTFPIGAMENWGLATFREDYLINPKSAKTEHAFSCASVIQHELSHYWFGDLVTIDWWSAAWLKEGMASFLELYMLDKADDAKYSAYALILSEHVQPALVADSAESTTVLTNYTLQSPAEISSHMDIITYSKGGSFLRMVMTFVGENAFQRGLSNYIKQNAYGWGTPMDLAWALQEASDDMNPTPMAVSVQDLFDSWTLKPGFPVITFTRDRVNGLATLTQSRFLSHDPTDEYDGNLTWHVPFNVWVQGQDVPTTYSDILLESQREKTILLDDADYKLVLINAGQTGFYRVNYDLLTWIYVFLDLPNKVIPSPEQRATLIHDSWALSLVGQLEPWVPLQLLLSGLPVEQDLLPWISSRKVIFQLRAILGAKQHDVALLDEFVLSVLGPAYEAVDWDSQWPEQEPYNEKRQRDIVTQLACTAGHALCRHSAQYQYEGWAFHPAYGNPDTLAASICEGARPLQDVQFYALWAKFLLEKDPTVRSSYLYGLGCLSITQRDYVLEAATLHDGITAKEAKIFLESFMVHVENGVQILLYYVEREYRSIKSTIGVKSAASILQMITERISTQSQHDAIVALAAQDPCIEMTVVIQTAASSLRWAMESLPLVKEYLAVAAGEAPPAPTPPPPPTAPTLPTNTPPSGDFRLPSSVVPEDYKLKIIPYLSGDKAGTFDGQVSIKITVKEDVSILKIHSLDLDFRTADITITSDDGVTQAVLSLSKSVLYEWTQIYLKGKLSPGSYTVQIQYRGYFSSNLKGLYVTTLAGDDGTSSVALTGKLAPTSARRVFPCFDEPGLKAPFTVTIGRLPSETALSNTPLQSTSVPDPSIGNRVLDTFMTTERVSTHSVVVVVASSLQSLKSVDNKFAVYGSDKLVANAKATLDAAVSVFNTLEATTGTPSGLSNMCLLGVKDLLVDGSDNWGIDILRENALVKMDSSPSSAEADIYWLTSMTHRLSQHWFGNLVSMAWWDNVWISDGFASYFQYKAASLTNSAVINLYPEAFGSRVLSPALAVDSMESANALNNPNVIGSSAGIEESITDISSLKGGSIVNSIAHILGATAFESGLKTFLANNHLGGVYPAALYTALQAGVDRDSVLPDGATVDAVLRPWVDRSGYPVVTVIRNYDSDSATLTQERFLLHSPSGNADLEAAWWVPTSFTTSAKYIDEYKAPIKGWIKPGESLDITLPDKSAKQWLLVNVDRKDFYRVNYDIQNWLMLAMNTPHELMITSRIMLLDDALAMARTGRLDHAVALQVADNLRVEDMSYEVFEAARATFSSSLDTFLLETKLEAVYKTWLSQLLDKAIKYLGFSPKSDDIASLRVARMVVMEWACDLGLDACTAPALADFQRWLDDTNSAAHDTVGAAVCAGVRADNQTFDRALANLALEMNDVYRQAIIRGLGCVADPAQAQSLLALATPSGGLRAGEALEVFKSATRFGPSSVDTALDYLTDKIIMLYEGAGMIGTVDILMLLESRATTAKQIEKLTRFVNDINPYSRKLAAAFLLAADNANWQASYLDEVGDVLYALTGVPNPDLPAPPTTLPPPTDPPTRPPPEPTTWFTLPPSSATSPLTLPPLPSRPTTQSSPTNPTTAPTAPTVPTVPTAPTPTRAPTIPTNPTKQPTNPTAPAVTTTETPATTPGAAAGVAVNTLVLVAALLLALVV